jgi:hypothetical protein
VSIPHWIGYRVVRQQDGVHLVGRNAAVPLVAVLFAFVAALPAILVSHEGDRVAGQPVAVLALLVLLFLGTGGALYLAKRVPMRRDIVFSREGIALNDAYLVGRAAREFAYSAVKEVSFSVHVPSRSLFKLTNIALKLRGQPVVMLVHGGCPMYSLRVSRDPGHPFQTIPDTGSEQAGQRFRLIPDSVSA